MGITFTSWTNGTWDGGPAFTLDWTSADTLRGVPAAILIEAIRQAAVERLKQCVWRYIVGDGFDRSYFYMHQGLSNPAWLTESFAEKPILVADLISIKTVLTDTNYWPIIASPAAFVDPTRAAVWDGNSPFPGSGSDAWFSEWRYADVLTALGMADVSPVKNGNLASEWAFLWYKILRLCHIRGRDHFAPVDFISCSPPPVYDPVAKTVTLAYAATTYGVEATKCSVQLWRYAGSSYTKIGDYPGPYTISATVPIVISVDLGSSAVELASFLDYNVTGGFTFQ